MNTMQQEFDAVVTHLYTQGRPARGKGGQCRYRAEFDGETLSCAVGCRIPDSVYDEKMDTPCGEDGTAVSSIVRKFKDVLPPEIVAYQNMFACLQYTHDNCETNVDGTFRLDRLEQRLIRDAKAFGLTTFTVPTTNGLLLRLWPLPPEQCVHRLGRKDGV